MTDDNLMTVEQFNNAVTKWALVVKTKSRGSLAETHGSGFLSAHIANFVDSLSQDSPAYKVKFNFERYGVFRSYGAGRGYVIVNGVPVRGYRIRSEKDKKNKIFSLEAGHYLKRGFSVNDVNSMKVTFKNDVRRAREPLNWIDVHINAGKEQLADLVQTFYGDNALRIFLKNFDKLKIVKK